MTTTATDFDYCNGAAHYVCCPANPPYDPIFDGHCRACGSWHVWFGNSPALVGHGAGACPNFNGNYAAIPRTHCKVSPWEHRP